MKEPIDKLFVFGYYRVLNKYDHVCYNPTRRKGLRSVNISSPVGMVEQIIKDHKEILEESKDDLTCILPILYTMRNGF